MTNSISPDSASPNLSGESGVVGGSGRTQPAAPALGMVNLKIKNPRKKNFEPITIEYFIERSIPEPNTGCWLWLGATQWNGYGAVRVGNKTKPAHRLAYETHHGVTLASDLDVCHKCDTRACVNPDHLFSGTRTDNMRDCSNKGRVVTPSLAGERCPASKLTPRQVIAIRSDPRSQRAIGRAYGVDHGTVGHIKRGSTWRSL
jgi:hypothetical protein